MKLLFAGLSYSLNLLPDVLFRALGNAIGLIWFHIIRFRRKVVLENLRIAYGSELTELKRNQLALENFCNYGQTLCEFFRALCWDKSAFLQRVDIEGLKYVQQFSNVKKGGFFLTLHQGCWELSILTTAAVGIPTDVVVKRSQFRSIDNLINGFRRKTGARILFESGTAKDILASLNEGRFVAFVLDQFMGPPIGLPVKFFGQTAGTAAALALFLERREFPVIPVYNYRDTSGKIHLVFHPPIQFPPLSSNKETRLYQRTQVFNDTLESFVRKHPAQWLWLHRRWKSFVGESRWKLTRCMSALLAILLLARCTTTPILTGIEIPPDPQVSVPEFAISASGEGVTTTPIAPDTDSADVPATTSGVPPTAHSGMTEERFSDRGSQKDKVKKTGKKKAEELTREKAAIVPPQFPKPSQPDRLVVPVLPPERIPFVEGERLELDLGWMALSAGRAVVEVRPGPVINGRDTFHFWGNVLSSRLVDFIYHIDNTIESFVDKAALIPYKFLLHMLETHQKKETRVVFDHPQSKAHYWTKRLSQKWGDEDQDRADEFRPLAHDMFSALYYVRTFNFELNKKENFFIYENKQTLEIELTPVANELVSTKVGTFQCWKVLVTVKLDNVLRPTGDMYVWLSDDSKKYIVKFNAKIKIGSLYGELVALRERS